MRTPLPFGDSMPKKKKIVNTIPNAEDYDTRVLISLPTSGDIRAEVVGWVMDAIRNGPPNGVHIGLQLMISSFPIDYIRNCQVTNFLATKCTHLFLLDSDCEPPKDCILKLLEHDKDIVTSIAPGIVAGKLAYTSCLLEGKAIGHKFKMVGPGSEELPSGITEVDACGATGVLIKRHVLESMQYPWFKVLYKNDGSGIDCGEDFYFCLKCKEYGYKVYADFDLVQNHYKTVELNGIKNLL